MSEPIDKWLNTRLCEIEKLLESKKLPRAKRSVRSAVNDLKRRLNAAKSGNAELANKLFYYAVFLRGIYDFVKLCELTKHTNNDVSSKTVEKVWTTLCDCQDRVGYCTPNMRGRMLERINEQLNALQKNIYDKFGPGLYVSPEIISNGMICSICNQDNRSCEHISGRLYNGTMCVLSHNNPRLVASALTERPYDRRCRIWPWQVNNSGFGEVLLTSFFRLDDFAESDDWK